MLQAKRAEQEPYAPISKMETPKEFPALLSISSRLSMVTEDCRTVRDKAESIADRAFGGSPCVDGSPEKERESRPGCVGQIEDQIDYMDRIVEQVVLQLNRLERLV